MHEAYEKRKAAVLAERRKLFDEIKEGFDYLQDKSPIAMPTPFGYVREETLQDLIKKYEDSEEYTTCSHDEAEFFHKARNAAKLADLSEGMEDCGDTLSRQVGGTHYKKGIQPWTIALDWGLDPWSHNVVKYILRFPYKGGIEDLKKIKHYLDYLIENYDEVKEKYYTKED